MAVYRHRDSWKVDIYVGGKRVKRKSGFTRKSDAEDFEQNYLRRFKENPEQFDQREEYTFEQLLARFKTDHFPKIKSSTARRYSLDIEERIEPYFQFMKLKRIEPHIIEEFQTSLVGKMKPKSVNNCLDTLRCMLNRGVRWNMLKESPFKVDSLKVPRSREKNYWESKEDVHKFLRAAKLRSRYYAAFLLALETGLRLGEVVGLSKKDVDFDRGQIYIWRQWSELDRAYAPLKDNEERTAYFDPKGELARALRDAIAQSSHPEAIFVSVNGKRISNRDLGRRWFKNICRKAGVPVISFHGLRHTYATWFMLEHDEIWGLKSALGHSNIKTTMGYAHHSESRRGKVLSFITPQSPPSEGDKIRK